MRKNANISLYFSPPRPSIERNPNKSPNHPILEYPKPPVALLDRPTKYAGDIQKSRLMSNALWAKSLGLCAQLDIRRTIFLCY